MTNKLGLFTVIISMFLTTAVFAQENLDLRTLLESSKLNIDYKSIDAGELIITSREDQETTDTSIALTMALYVKGRYKDVLLSLQAGNNKATGYKDAQLIEIKDYESIDAAFSGVKFSKNEVEAVEDLFSDGDDSEYNFSEEEIAQLKSIKNETLQSASNFMSEILSRRMKEYMKGGVSAIQDYAHDSKETTVQNNLKTSSKHINVLKNSFPELYYDFINYPRTKSKKYKQKFYYSKDMIDDKLTFTLKHQMIEEKDNLFIILERQFYISTGLDTIQTEILCMPYKEGTFVALSSQSFTDKVSGFGRTISVKVGRHMMKKNILPIFETLQKKFPN